MKKVILILFLCTILYGCTSSTSTTQASNLVGTDGITATIGQIPSPLYAGQGLEIPVTLENAGAYDVQNAILSVSSYDPAIVQFSSPTRYEGINLFGRSNFVPAGQKTTKIFTISNLNLPNTNEKIETLQILTCYPYETQASPIVCINPQLEYGQTITQGACSFTDAQVSSSQGAPVAVTKVETWYHPDQLQLEFRIYVSDVSGKGYVVRSASYDKLCLGTISLSNDDINLVGIQAYMSGKQINCYPMSDLNSNTPINSFNLSSQSTIASVRCRAPLDTTKPAFTTPLSIYLSYGYVYYQSVQLDIKNPNVAAAS